MKQPVTLLLASFIACFLLLITNGVLAKTPFSFYEYASKDYLSSHFRPVKYPEGYGMDMSIKNIIGTCKIDSTVYIATDYAIYKMVNPSKFAQVINIGVTQDMTCGDKYLFYIKSDRTSIGRIDLTSGATFSFTPGRFTKTYSNLKGIGYNNGFLYFTHWDQVQTVSSIYSIGYQLWIEKSTIDGVLTQLYTADTSNLEDNSYKRLYKGLKSLVIKNTAGDMIYNLAGISLSLSVDTDDTIYLIIDGDYSMASKQKRVYKITQPEPADAELIAWCSYGEVYDVDGDATNSKCGPLSTYLPLNSKKYFLSNNNIKLFTGDATSGTVSTFLSFERKLVAATQLNSKSLIVAESSSVYFVDLDLLSTTKIAGGDTANIGDGNSYKFAYFKDIYKIAKKGNFLYVVEKDGQRIRKIDLLTEIITTVANVAPYYPRTITIDDTGLIYCLANADSKTYILKITAATGNVIVSFGGASTPGSDGANGNSCYTSCFFGEVMFGAFSTKSQSMYAMQGSKYMEQLCKHNAANQGKNCITISDLTSTSYQRVVFNVAVVGDYVYLLKKNLVEIYTLDLVYVGKISSLYTFASAGSAFFVSENEQIFATFSSYGQLNTLVRDKIYQVADGDVRAASDLLLLENGSIMYVHPPTNSIKILNPKGTCIGAIPGLDMDHKCEIQCGGVYSSAMEVCSGRGACVFNYDANNNVGSAVCRCRPGLNGTACEGVICPDCEVKCFDKATSDSSICSGHGSCVALDKCSCSANYNGNQCQYTTCNGIENLNSTVCSGNGVCSAFNNCTCISGFTGANCEETTCFGTSSSDPSVCGGHGKCVAKDTCKCQSGYVGNQCQAISCFGIPASNPLACSGHGSCLLPDNCTCTGSFTGSSCNITTCGSMRSDNPEACGSIDSGWCESKDTCVCKPGMVKTDSLTCKRPCGSCTGSSSNKFCKNYSAGVNYCSPAPCSNPNTLGATACTSYGLSYCGANSLCAYECASDVDCTNEYRLGACDLDSTSANYRTCKKTCASNADCPISSPNCVQYTGKGSRCEKNPCTSNSNCTNPNYPYCFRSVCDNIQCSVNSDCAAVNGKPYCGKEGLCTPMTCYISSECTSGDYKYCSYQPNLNGTSLCALDECSENENCRNVNGRPICSSSKCVTKSCSSDTDCPQTGVNNHCINSECKPLHPLCVSNSDCSSYTETPTCDTALKKCVPTKCTYSKYCPKEQKGCRVTPYSSIYGNSTKVCTMECENNSHCSNMPGKPDCFKNTCTSRTCSQDSDCPQDGSNKYCKSGQCKTACLVDNDCYGTFNVCMAKNGYECADYNLNDICETNDDCPSKFGACLTSPVTGLKNCGKECIANSNCTDSEKPSCDLSTYICAPQMCSVDYDCLGFPYSPKCESSMCRGECYDDVHCDSRPGTKKCDLTKKKCITQTCTDDQSCASYGEGFFPHCVNGMCRHECRFDYECSVSGKGKCNRPANANSTDGGICVAQSCTKHEDCSALKNRNSFCVNSVCNYECNTNDDCKDKPMGAHTCIANKCTNYCSEDQPCKNPWFNQCLSNYCFPSCGSGNDCKSVKNPKCMQNSDKIMGGSMCSPAPCSTASQCGSSNEVHYLYDKCMNSTCASCIQNSDCTIDMQKYYCGIGIQGLTYCTYQPCSSSRDCPVDGLCAHGSVIPASFNIPDPEKSYCLLGFCLSDSDCSGTVKKHKCYSGKCYSECSTDSECLRFSTFPTCNTTTGDCGPTPCSSSADCIYSSYPRCAEGVCKTECDDNSQCAGRTDRKNACINQKCTNYCDANVTCSNPWFKKCSSNTCVPECSSYIDCKSVKNPKCIQNSDKSVGGGKCGPAPCSVESECTSESGVHFLYSKCLNNTCAACIQNSECALAPHRHFCIESQESGFTTCNYKYCSLPSDCPSGMACRVASAAGVYEPNFLPNPDAKVCVDFECDTDADCSGTVNKHNCQGRKCAPNCLTNNECLYTPSVPVCNTTTGDCSYKPCTSLNDCYSAYPNTYCRTGYCKKECDSNDDCKTAAKPRCEAGTCSQECTLDIHCNSTSACDTSTNKCRIKLNQCSTNDDCSYTYNKHKCASWKECVPFCTSNSTCPEAFRPYCNATGECTLKPCFSNSDCGASFPICNKGTCDIECASSSECKNPYKSKCSNNICVPECTSNYDCGNNFCVNSKCTPCNSDGFCDGTKGCGVQLDGTKACNYKLCNADSDCKGLLYKSCKPASTFGYYIAGLTSNTSATVCTPECTTNAHCTADPKYQVCKYGTCGPECAVDNDCFKNYQNKKSYCSAGVCTSCDQVTGRDVCAKINRACHKDSNNIYDCAFKKCSSSSDCENLGTYSACIPYSSLQMGPSNFYPSTQTVCFYECNLDSPTIACTDAVKSRCDLVTKKCAPECVTSADCTSGKICLNNKCSTGCTDSSQCGKPYEICQDFLLGSKGCAHQKCSSNSDCKNPNYPSCVVASIRGLSVSSISSNSSQKVCFTECSSISDCKDPNKPKCSNSKCVESCLTDSDCQSTISTKTPYCYKNKCTVRLCANNNDCLGMGFYNSECRSGLCQEQCSNGADCPASNPICTSVSARASAKSCVNYDTYCTNFGFSYNAASGSSCVCGSGKSGQFCQVQTNSTCTHGNSLLYDEVSSLRTVDAPNPGYCKCYPGYSGPLCTVPQRSLCSKACANGQCVGSGATELCICDDGYEGDLCEKRSTVPCTLKCVNGQCNNDNGVSKCICDQGFEGDLCEKKIPNPCTLKCVNGQCNNDNGASKCICTPGFEGDLCEKKIPNPCTLRCVNGLCNNSTGIAKCICSAGFEGDLCEKQSTVPCTLKCVNGQCNNDNGVSKCICNQGFEGDLCEKKIPNPCTMKCVNGLCNNSTGIAKCICNQGFEGDLCEKQSTVPCTLKCVNGQCSNDNGVSKCICNQGFEGDLCEKKIPNPCTLRCVNGLCNNSTGIAKCMCNNGYEGDLCEKQSTVPCTLQCVNGQCNNDNGVSKCICKPGFEGDLCEKQSTVPCTLKCVNGQCNNDNGVSKCICDQGFEGDLCEKKIPNPCTLRCVNGLCNNSTGIAKCMCNNGYEGDLCEKQSCNLKCVYGQCGIENRASKCICNQGFEGDLCEKKIPNPCTMKCVNGLCNNSTGIAKCICSSGFEGDLCDKRICSRQCLNGGACKFDASNNQICSCVNGYSGALCQLEPGTGPVACKLPCMNGGVCVSNNGTTKCLCASDLFVGDLCSSCKTGFVLQKGVCMCPNGFNNENGNCVRLPADCQPSGCGQYGQCVYKDITGYQGYCKCKENYVTELSTKPCGSCISGYIMNAQGKCVKVCPQDFTGEDCNIYTPTASCVPIPPSGTSFCKAHLQKFTVLNTHYASGAANATDARQLIINAMNQLGNTAKELYDSNIAKILKQGVCNSTCEESNARLACYSVINNCNSATTPETRLCKSVCNYIVKDIRTYYPDFEDPCSNLEDVACFYGAYLPPDTSCFGKKYTDSSVCSGRGECVGTDKCACKNGFTGSQCSSPVCFGKSSDQPDVCSGNGVCSGPNSCTCSSGFSGIDCNVVTCNGKAEKEGGCSYRGVCSSVTRTCVCNGNFVGGSCSKCKDGFTGPQCDIPVCNGISSIDKAVCGGRGSCNSDDGIPKCQCVDGYQGSNCQNFVCNGTDRSSADVCSSKGKCIGVDTCSCTKNYNPATFCSTCLPSFNGLNCENKMCTPETTCRGRGTCDAQFKCVCSGKFTGQYCDRCIDGYVGDECQYQCSAETTCNRKGTCSSDGSCICSGNAEGSHCETCKSGWFGEKCDFSVDTSSFGFSENGDSITGTVMSSLRKRIECSALISNVEVLGTNPVCSLNGEKSLLTISLGISSSITIGGTLNVKKYIDNELTQAVTVAEKSYKAVEPVAVLVADKSTISKACGSIYLDASGSSSLDRRSLIYSWTTTVAPSSTEVLDLIISKLSTPGVKFSASDLDVGTYVVQVTVKSSFSLRESVSSVTFSVIAATPPTISIKNGLESSMVIGSPYIISPIVTFPSCYKGSGNLVYTYSLEKGNPLNLEQKNELLVFNNEFTKLTEEGEYYFKLTAKEDNAPEATITFKVTASALPLKVAFSIRDMTQSFEDPVSFSISKQDPSNPTEAGGTVYVSCSNIDTASTCDGFIDGEQNIDQSTLKVEKKMNPGVYYFTATYTKSSRTSTTSVKVTVSDQSKSTVLRVSISGPKNADLVAIDPSMDLILQATSLDTLTSSRVFTWSSSEFSFDSSVDTNKQYIIIPKSLLAPGASYTLNIKVEDGQKSGDASFSFTVNSPPTMGTLEVTPKSGIALSDEFKISCGNGWSDPQLPLTFKFFSKASTDTNWKLLKEQSETRSFGTSLPAGELEIKVVVFDSKGASTETTTTVSVSMPKDASSAITALSTSSSGTMTTSSVSSALSVIQSVKTDDPEQKKQLAEVGKQIVLSFFEQKATEENLSSQTSTSTSSTLSVISSISSCVDNLPDDTIRMIIEKFNSATNVASSSSSISLDDAEIKSSTDSASLIQNYVSNSLNGKRSIRAPSFTIDDLNKIDQVKNNLMNIKLKNVVPDMPAVRGFGIKSLSYVRLVNTASLNRLVESVAENGLASFNLSSTFSEIPQISSLESVKISVKVYENSNATFKSTSKIFDFVVSNTDNTNVMIQYSKPIAQLTIEKSNSSIARVAQEPRCNMISDGVISESSSCSIVGTNSDSYVVSVTSTGAYIIGTTLSNDVVQPEKSTNSENPTPIIPTTPVKESNLDYIALILLIIPVALVIGGVIGLIVCLRRKKQNAAPNDIEMRSTV